MGQYTDVGPDGPIDEGVYFELIDYRELFNNLTIKPIFANDIVINSENDLKAVNQLLYTRYTGETLGLTSMDDSPFMKKIESEVWLRPPDGVKAFINPMMWSLMSARMKVGKTNVLEWLTNPYYKPLNNPKDEWLNLIEAKVPRGLNNFIDNFDEIIAIYFKPKGRANKVDIRYRYLLQMIEENRHLIFTPYLPIPSKEAFVVEQNATGTYADIETMVDVTDAFRTITSIRDTVIPLNQAALEARAVKVIALLSIFQEQWVANTQGGKYGGFRKHRYGGPLNFSARNIISSIQGPHDYEELHVPWGTALELLSPVLYGRLIRKGYSHMYIAEMFSKYSHAFSQELYDEMMDIIRHYPRERLPTIFQRNPSLAHGSGQLLPLARIKTDPNDNTTSLSNLVIAAPNADFDGDEMNQIMLLGKDMANRCESLRPHYNLRDLNKPRKYSGIAALNKPITATLINFLDCDDLYEEVNEI